MEMKLLVLADIHGQEITLQNVLDTVLNLKVPPTSCLIAGDVTNFGTIAELNKMLNMIAPNFEETLFVAGNCDPYFELNELESTAMYIESNPHKTNSFTTIGFGRQDPRINQRVLRKLNRAKEKVCLLTHAPPFGTAADKVSFDRHAGSKELKYTIDRYPNIFLVISGHIHDSPIIDTIDICTIVNPGPITRGNFAVICIDEDFRVTGNLYNINEMGR